MKTISKIFLMLTMMLLLQCSTVYAENQPMTSMHQRNWIKEALNYGFDMKTDDYTKYMSKTYIEHIDGKVYTYFANNLAH